MTFVGSVTFTLTGREGVRPLSRALIVGVNTRLNPPTVVVYGDCHKELMLLRLF